MLQYDKNTLCKLLAAPEVDFYQSIPESLKKFTPDFRGLLFTTDNESAKIALASIGVVTVQYFEDESGYIRHIARPLSISVDQDSPHNEQETSASVDPPTPGNNPRKPVQCVLCSIVSFHLSSPVPCDV